MNQERIANDLLYPLWRGIDSGYKAKYARNIWQQFEDNIRSAAYTSKLGMFVDSISRRLSISVRGEDVERLNLALAAGNDRETLKLLRDETTLLVLMVRLKNDERKAECEKSEFETERMPF